MEDWKLEVEGILRQIPGYDPFASPGDAYLDHAAALAAINWFPDNLKHVIGSSRGEPFILRPWQAAIAGNLAGWKRRDEAGRIVRRYRQCLMMVARGNGKTPFVAGLVLELYYNDNEAGAECYLAAGQKEQAGLLFKNAAGMIDQNVDLQKKVDIYRGAAQRSIVLKDDPISFIKTIPAEAAGQHGGIPHIIAVDELHVQESRDLLDVFETGMSKKVRSQPLLLMITTSDYERQSVCNEVYGYADKVRDGIVDDPSFLPVIYELKAEDDWRDEANWFKANPNLDVSVSRESLRKIIKKAEALPALESEIKRLHFNIKTGQNRSAISMPSWDDCRSDRDAKELATSLIGRSCYGGLDSAARNDLASFSLVFHGDEGLPVVLNWSWCPEERIKWRQTRRIPYDVWAKAGWITPTPGDRIDHDRIADDIIALSAIYSIEHVSVDIREAGSIVTKLQEASITVVETPQTFVHMSVPTKELLSRVATKGIRHDGNPVLRWAIGNLSLYFKGTVPLGEDVTEFLDKVPVMPSKRTSADKIDPVTATILALGRYAVNPEGSSKKSIYETRGVRVI